MDPAAKLISLISQFHDLKDTKKSDPETYFPKLSSVITQAISLVRSMDLDFDLQSETELMSLTSQTIHCFISIDLDSQPSPLRKLITIFSQPSPELPWESGSDPYSEFVSLVDETWGLKPLPELISCIQKLISFVDSNPVLKAKSLITRLIFFDDPADSESFNYVSKFISLSVQLITLISSAEWDLQPKHESESELISLINQSISVFNSMDFDSEPKILRELVTLTSQRSSIVNFLDSNPNLEPDLMDSKFLDLLDEPAKMMFDMGFWTRESYISDTLQLRLCALARETLNLEPEPKLISLIHQIISLVMSINSKWKKLISFSPQVQLQLKQGRLLVAEQDLWSKNDKWDFLDIYSPGERQVSWRNNNKWDCLPFNWEKFRLPGEEDDTHFICRGCFGQNHKENSKVLVETKHPLHPKHFLQPALLNDIKARGCYCCIDRLRMLYYCSPCDFAIRFTCMKKQRVLSIDHPKWHEHTLALFPSHAPLTCSLCALKHSSCPFYICAPCDFVAHQSCLSNLPRLIRISRHPHRIAFTYSFQKGDWSCGVCRKKIDNDYGGYSCIKDGCHYAAHSKCATQKNVWDEIELEGVQEEESEELEPPFKVISRGIIRHFSHENHQLRLDENMCRDYDDNKLCQACIMPIYLGNFYSCLQCDFILHEECAQLPRKIHHPVHPHMLTLVTDQHVGVRDIMDPSDPCSACPSLRVIGYFYECQKEVCRFRLHVQCAIISEPLVHPSHVDPLFLTSKPDELRICLVCKKWPNYGSTKETFNCIEEGCDFALCFRCATLPQKVRYKHDKHMLPLFYGEETSSMTYWCESCEEKIKPEEGFYKCDEYCCVNLHITCMFGKDLYLKPGSSWSHKNGELHVLPNSMSRPICSSCKNRCPQKIVFQLLDFSYCCVSCIPFRIPETD